MKVPFTKMHGLGNDFVVFDFTNESYALSQQQAADIADRHFGVGCDQILIVEKSVRPEIDFKYRILNADGGEVSQCGNGARCFAKFVHDQGLTDNNPIMVETLNGDLVLEHNRETGLIQVNMGIPNFNPDQVPILTDSQEPTYTLNVDGEEIEFSALSIGNPHAVIQVNNTELAPVDSLGPALQSDKFFPEQVNVGFMQINDQQNFSLRVFERGSGETIACGSGACAAAVAGMQLGLLENSVTAHLRGGDLQIQWEGSNQPVMMTGPATTVYTGEIEL